MRRAQEKARELEMQEVVGGRILLYSKAVTRGNATKKCQAVSACSEAQKACTYQRSNAGTTTRLLAVARRTRAPRW